MYLDEICSDNRPINHVATLLPFWRDYASISRKKTRTGAAGVDFFDHLISANDVRPNDNRVTALSRMPIPTDIRKLSGHTYYRDVPAQYSSPYTPDDGLPHKRRYIRIHLHNGKHHSCLSRRTRITTDRRLLLPPLGRGYRQIPILPLLFGR